MLPSGAVVLKRCLLEARGRSDLDRTGDDSGLDRLQLAGKRRVDLRGEVMERRDADSTVLQRSDVGAVVERSALCSCLDDVGAGRVDALQDGHEEVRLVRRVRLVDVSVN